MTAQLLWLAVLAMPIACISWTFTHEEVFREPRDFCARHSRTCAYLWERKFFYALTCEFCFSHYVTVGFLFLTRYKLLIGDWRGYIIAEFALVWLANLYMGIYGRLRLGIKAERKEIEFKEELMSRRSR